MQPHAVSQQDVPLVGFLPCRCMASNPMKNIWYCPMPEVCTPFATRKSVVMSCCKKGKVWRFELAAAVAAGAFRCIGYHRCDTAYEFNNHNSNVVILPGRVYVFG